jgi:hypothetical protein
MRQTMYAAVIAIGICMGAACFAQDAAKQADNLQSPAQQQVNNPVGSQDVVKGTVKEIASDKSFITVDGTKILTTKEFLEDSYLEVGDKIEVSVEKTDQGLKAKSYNYIFEEEALPMDSEEGAPSEEAPAQPEK